MIVNTLIQKALTLEFSLPLFLDLFKNMFLYESDPKDHGIVYIYLFLKFFHLNNWTLINRPTLWEVILKLLISDPARGLQHHLWAF